MTTKTKINLWLAVVLTVLLVIFILLNTSEVEVNLLIATVTIGSGYLILGCIAAGVVLGWLTRSVMGRKGK